MIVAIEDTVAEDLATNITLHHHQATAMRWWSDAASQNGSWLQTHLADHQLVQLGWLEENGRITDDRLVLMTGDQWIALQQAMAARPEVPVNG